MVKKYRMSSAQKRLFAIDQSQDVGTSYNMPVMMSFEGKIEKDKLQHAIKGLSEKYELLRTNFAIHNNEFVQIVSDSQLVTLDYCSIKKIEDIESYYADFIRPFDLTSGPLMRIQLIEEFDGMTYLMIDIHHIIADGESIGLIWRDLSKAYAGEELERPKIQYKDFSAWENKLDLTKQKEFWINEFMEEVPTVELVTDFPRKNKQSYNGKVKIKYLNKVLNPKIAKFCSENSSTEFIFFLAVFNILLSKYARQKAIIIGSPFSGRINAQLQNMLGMFVNTLPIKTVVESNENFLNYLEQVKEKCFSIYENQNYPFENLLSDLDLTRDSSRNPIFDIMFAQESASETIYLDEFEAKIMNPEIVTAKFDLSLTMISKNDGYTVGWEYCTDLFKEETIEIMAEHYETLLENVLNNPGSLISELSMINRVEEKLILEEFNKTEAYYPKEKTIIQLFEEQAMQNPNGVAVVFEGENYSYKDINGQANAIGAKLRNLGIKPDDIVGLISESSVEMIVGILGILKSGAAYMPIDPKHPIDRVSYMVQNSEAKVILFGQGGNRTLNKLLVEFNELETIDLCSDKTEISINLPLLSRPNHLAYIIFTSGSTGTPKGVMVENQGVVNVSYWQILNGEIDNKTRVIQNYNYIFDASVSEIFPTLIAGGTLLMLSEEDKKNPGKYLELLVNSQLCCVPSMFREILEYAKAHNLIDKLIQFDKLYLAAEALPIELLKDYMNSTGRNLDQVYNIYGPTETTDSAICYDFSGMNNVEKVLIGKPISNLKLYVLNENQLCGIGVPGELCISGDGMTRGYLNRPDLTEEKFVENPYLPGRKMYRTGDLVRWTPDGNIDYLGRIDEQVKIRGFRIELGEIESKLRALPEVSDAAVLVKENNGSKIICGYIITESSVEPAYLKEELSQNLPEYMIPACFVQLEEFPRTRTGKLDRKALPDPSFTDLEEYIEPRNEREEAIVQVFQDVLNIDGLIGIDANFFSLGGDSIKAIRIISKLREKGYSLKVPDIMDKKTPRRIAQSVQVKEEVLEIDQSEVIGEVSLIPIQKAFMAHKGMDKHHFNQSVFLQIPTGLALLPLKQALRSLTIHHDMLRATYREGKQIILSVADSEFVAVESYDYTAFPLEKAYAMVDEQSTKIQASMDLENGPLLRAGVFQLQDGDYLLLSIHHLVVDGVSWRILIEDLKVAYEAAKNGKEIQLPPKTHSFKEWGLALQSYRESSQLQSEVNYWKTVESKVNIGKLLLPVKEEGLYLEPQKVTMSLSKKETENLLQKAGTAYSTEINDLLLTAVGRAVNKITGQTSLAIHMEGHGREAIVDSMVIDRTVGWFTSTYPVVLEELGDSIGMDISKTKETLRRIPHHGIGYGILNELGATVLEGVEPDLTFNYLGEFQFSQSGEDFSESSLSHGRDVSEKDTFHTKLSLDGAISDKKLSVVLSFNGSEYVKEEMDVFIQTIKDELLEVIQHCLEQKETIRTPFDLGEENWSLEEYNNVVQKYAEKGYEVDRIIPMTGMQEGMLYHKLLNEESSEYVVQSVYSVSGLHSVEHLKMSLDLLKEKHGVLETSIAYQNVSEPRQVMLKGRDIEFNEIDLSQSKNQEKEREAFLKEDVRRGFDLENDSLIRVAFIHLENESPQLVISFHHIIMDGWCTSILMNDLIQFYSQLESGVQKNTIHENLSSRYDYESYIRLTQKNDKKAARNYWTELLENYDNESIIKGSIENNSIDGEIQVHEVHLSIEDTQKIEELCQFESLTLNTFVEAAWGILLQHYTNQNDVVYGKIVSGRNIDIPGIEDMVGLFINTIPIRVETKNKETFLSMLSRLQKQAIKSSEFDYCSLAEIQSQCTNLENDLVHTVIAFENYYTQESPQETSLKLELLSGREETNYPLTVAAYKDEALKFGFMYQTDKFTENDIISISNHFVTIIKEAITKNDILIDEIDFIDEEEKNLVINSFNNTTMNFANSKLIVELFEDVVKNNPDKVALKFKNELVTYKELNNWANCIGYSLRNSGVGKNDVVAFVTEKCNAMVAGILGILKSGATYLPIDASHPNERVNYMLDNASVNVILQGSGKTLSSEILNKYRSITIDDISVESIPNLPHINDIEDLAYIIYTSGTTGNPKGVKINNRNVLNLVEWQKNNAEFNNKTVVLQYFNYIFDGSVWEIFPALLSGVTLEIVPEEYRNEPSSLINMFKDRQLTIVPSLFIALMDYAIENKMIEQFNSFDKLFLAGESLPLDVIRKYQNISNGKIDDVFNVYGPTETTVCSTYYRFNSKEKIKEVLIGKPIGNTKLYILKGNKLCGVGIEGELCIAGEGVSEGYVNQPELTEEKFVENPYNPEERIYRTGDLARWTSDGNIEYLGRIDEQVKIRGYRIELSEIEGKLRLINGVKDAIVIPKMINNNHELCAYILSEQTIDFDYIRKSLERDLPDYMVPHYMMTVTEFTKTKSGKVDKKALPVPQLIVQNKYEEPRNSIEQVVVDIFKEVLEVSERISVTDSFFDYGGDSLKAIKVISMLRKKGYDCNIREIMDRKSARKISEFFENEKLLLTKETKVNVNFNLDEYISKNYGTYIHSKEKVVLVDKVKYRILFVENITLNLKNRVLEAINLNMEPEVFPNYILDMKDYEKVKDNMSRSEFKMTLSDNEISENIIRYKKFDRDSLQKLIDMDKIDLYSPSPIQEYLLTFPYSIIQDEFTIRGAYHAEDFIEATKYLIKEHGSLRSVLLKANGLNLIGEISSDEVQGIEYVDLRYSSLETYDQTMKKIKSIDHYKNMNEWDVLSNIFIVHEDEVTFSIHISSHHSVWDKASSLILKNELIEILENGLKPNISRSRYSDYAQLSNQLVENEDQELTKFISEYENSLITYSRLNYQNKIVRAELAVVKIPEEILTNFDEEIWGLMERILDVIVFENKLTNGSDVVPLQFVQEERSSIDHKFMNQTGPIIDMLPLMKKSNFSILDQINQVKVMKKVFGLNWLNIFRENFKLMDGVLLINYLGLYEMNYKEYIEDISSDNYEAAREITFSKYEDKLIVRYPVFENCNKNIKDLLKEKVNPYLQIN
ncbi:amino acid adenylation domain-containing protein [Bacillus sp. S13(2024)]|uniref:amino acid adenylation domain-containing protein n=1 Tax=unclassified Bacillus (in: firmicutes) TaxID=185979 RepID=UPI003D1A066A